jgi:hypothetical protein
VEPQSFGYEDGRGADCLLWGHACADLATLMLHHGDHQCVTDEGGTDCFVDNYPRNPKLVYGPIGIIAEFNDVRPASSPPMTWWYQISIRISAKKDAAPLSSHYIVNSGNFGFETATDSLSSFTLHRVSTRFTSSRGACHLLASSYSQSTIRMLLRFKSLSCLLQPRSTLVSVAPRAVLDARFVSVGRDDNHR